MQRTGPSAITVAVRGPPSSTAISPTSSPWRDRNRPATALDERRSFDDEHHRIARARRPASALRRPRRAAQLRQRGSARAGLRAAPRTRGGCRRRVRSRRRGKEAACRRRSARTRRDRGRANGRRPSTDRTTCAMRCASAPPTSGVSLTISNACSGPSPSRPAKRSESAGLRLLEHAYPEAGVLAQQRVHLRAPVDRDENQRRLQRHGHERVGGHAVDLLADPRRDHGHAGRKHAERPPELRRLEVRRYRRLLEDRVPDPRRRRRYGEFARKLHLGGL